LDRADLSDKRRLFIVDKPKIVSKALEYLWHKPGNGQVAILAD